MMTRGDLHSLRDLLDREVTAAQAFLETLEQEGEALRNNDVAAVEALAEHKQTQAQDLEQLTQAHQDQVKALGAPSDRDQMSQWCNQQDPNGALGLVDLWESLRQVAAACADANQRNGQVVLLARRQVEKALSLLRGSVGDGCYSRDGGTNSGASSRTLGEV